MLVFKWGKKYPIEVNVTVYQCGARHCHWVQGDWNHLSKGAKKEFWKAFNKAIEEYTANTPVLPRYPTEEEQYEALLAEQWKLDIPYELWEHYTYGRVSDDDSYAIYLLSGGMDGCPEAYGHFDMELFGYEVPRAPSPEMYKSPNANFKRLDRLKYFHWAMTYTRK